MNQPAIKHVYISGRVQGVGYRHSLAAQAERLNIKGWCRNLPDGRVEATLQGNENQLAAILDWCQQGPPHARVNTVEAFELSEAPVFSQFEIRP